MKDNLTNHRTVLEFNQYGERKVLEFNGTITAAKSYLKRNLGIKETFKEFHYTTEKCFLKNGWACISNYEERYFIH